MKKGTLYAVGVGPGDPELITMKAARLLRQSANICVPRGSEGGRSIALDIISKAVDLGGKRIIEVHFPMKKGAQREALAPAAREVANLTGSGEDVVFATLGDPVLYSTFFHLLDAIKGIGAEVAVEIVPGVTSITAASARAGVDLALSTDKLAVLPASYMDDLEPVLDAFDTVVLMKVHRVFGAVREALARKGLLGRAVFVSRVGFPDEVVLPVGEVKEEHLNYFSIVIVRKRDV